LLGLLLFLLNVHQYPHITGPTVPSSCYIFPNFQTSHLPATCATGLSIVTVSWPRTSRRSDTSGKGNALNYRPSLPKITHNAQTKPAINLILSLRNFEDMQAKTRKSETFCLNGRAL